jgi:DNA-binding response OmpR family regulator
VKGKVLIVEDDLGMAGFLSNALEMVGYYRI